MQQQTIGNCLVCGRPVHVSGLLNEKQINDRIENYGIIHRTCNVALENIFEDE